MSLTTIRSQTRGDAEPLSREAIECIRQLLAGNYSRSALGSFNVNHTTLTAALAGLPIAAGSRALIEKAIAEKRPAT